MPTPEERLQELGVSLPAPAVPVAAYVPCVRTGSLVYVSGQVPVLDGKPSHLGHLGDNVDLEDGRAAARTCAVNVLAALKAELGELSRVRRVVKVTGFVASTPDFTDHPKVINAASELLGDAFGDAGRHARAAIGVAALPLGAPVEVEAIVEVA
ncbi:MAG TPA: RidA family protein [Actinomycetota bacterium]|jgi:enamine deaminase RidA (YjgF/YER057c/UK114 family)|nr:RidA family protein [Actinomycetota bacterium]